MRHLPAEQRQAWGRVFSFFLFDPGQDPIGHIPEQRRGVLGPLSQEQTGAIRQMIKLR
jgi:hypothetical protein